MRQGRSDDVPGAWHHVMNRGARRHDVFVDDRDRSGFLKLAQDVFDDIGSDLAAWCLMPNHFHFMVHCPTEGLSAAMQRFCISYVKRFNRLHGFDGPLFRARFKSVRISSDQQLVAVARYIHRNPLDLRYRIDAYPWSDLGRWLAGRKSLALKLCGGPRHYRKLVFADLAHDKTKVGDGTRVWLPEPPGSLLSLESIAAVVKRTALDDRAQRAAAVLVALDAGRFASSDIARFFGLSSASSARTLGTRARRRVEGDPAFARAVENVRAALHPRAA